jgi:hypothetical protein
MCFIDFRLNASFYGALEVVGIISLLIFGFCGCGATTSPAKPLVNALAPLAIPTYDGSGQVVEPDVIFFDSPWHGFRYWIAVSPYPFTDPSKENPTIVVSNDGVNWQGLGGQENPLVLPNGGDHLSDASVFYDHESD